MDLAQVGFILLAGVAVLQNHRVAVAAGEDGRHLAVAKGAVQRGADIGYLHAGGIGAVAVDVDLRLQAVQLRIAGDVAKQRLGAHLALHLLRPIGQLTGAHALQHILKAALADAPAQPQVLHRRHEHRHARLAVEFLPQLFQHLVHWLPRVARMQADEQAAAIAAGDARGHIRHIRIGLNDVGGMVDDLHHGRVRHVLRTLDSDLDLADILAGKKPFRDRHEQQGGQNEGQAGDRQHGLAVRQRPIQSARIGSQHRLEPCFKPARQPAFVFTPVVLQIAAA